jgi:hypothetical protein
MAGVTKEDLENWFSYHAPQNGSEIEKYTKIRDKAKEFAQVLLENTPSCPDQTVAIRKIREAVMTANASIACGGK